MNRALILTTILLFFHPVTPGRSACVQKDSEPQQSGETACWQKASTQLAMNECAGDDLKRSDAELNTTYRLVLSKHSNDPRRIAQIKKAETAWVAFRDAEIDALFPESTRAERGSIYPMCRAMHLTRLTSERTKALKAMLEHEEGDVCKH